MKRIWSLLLICLFVVIITDTSLAGEKIVVSGTGDSQELLRVLADAFERANPGMKVEVPDTIGTSGGVRAVGEGKCDLARVARSFTDREKLYNLHYELFAYSPIAFAVNPSVKSIDSIASEQIIGIFSGRITSWSELGGQKKKIYVAQREIGDSCRRVLEEKLPGWKEIKDFAGELIYTTPEAVSVLVKHKYTIGYLPLSMTRGKDLTVLKVNGLEPSLENVKNGSYNLAVPFGLAWKGELKGVARSFVDFIFSPEGRGIIIENGAVPVK